MADFNTPAVSDSYVNILAYLKNRDVDILRGLDPATTSPTNVPTDAIRWNSASAYWEKYNGSSWSALTALYAISISGNALTATTAASANSVTWSNVSGKPTTWVGLAGVDSVTADPNNRLGTGFYQQSSTQTANGWPAVWTWGHLLSVTHSTLGNYFAMQFAADFYSNSLYYRSTNNSGVTAWSKVWMSTNDGSGSGLDADLLDGYNAAQSGANVILKTNASGDLLLDGWVRVGNTQGFYNSVSQQVWFIDTTNLGVRSGDASVVSIVLQNSAGTQRGRIYADSSSNQGFLNTGGSWRFVVPNTLGTSLLRDNTYAIWDSGNDGSGSGLDADLLDGVQASSFARVDSATNFTTAPTINSATIWHSGNDGSGSGLDADLLDGLGTANGASASTVMTRDASADSYLRRVGLLDSNSSHYLIFIAGSDITATRNLIFYTGDASRNITLNGDTTLSGTNTGDQTITLTGDVTGSGTGSFGATIGNDVVSFAKMQNIGQDTLVGRASAGTGDPEQITCTSFARTLLDDTSNTVARSTLGLGTAATYNVGSGNSLDADFLDGQHGSYYAPLASPGLTGTPTAPTASAGTSTTQIATTAFVNTAGRNSLGARTVSTGQPSGGSDGDIWYVVP